MPGVGDIKSRVPLWVIATQPYIKFLNLSMVLGEQSLVKVREGRNIHTIYIWWLFQVTKKYSVQKELIRGKF